MQASNPVARRHFPLRSIPRCLLLAACLSLGAALAALSHVAWAQPSSARAEPPEQRVERLVRALTPVEAITLLGGTGFGTQPIARLGIPGFMMSDGPAGVRSPAPSMAYASGIALAASWDEALAECVGVQLGRDARARGVQFLLGPGNPGRYGIELARSAEDIQVRAELTLPHLLTLGVKD